MQAAALPSSVHSVRFPHRAHEAVTGGGGGGGSGRRAGGANGTARSDWTVVIEDRDGLGLTLPRRHPTGRRLQQPDDDRQRPGGHRVTGPPTQGTPPVRRLPA